jgi:hypothetical protein
MKPIFDVAAEKLNANLELVDISYRGIPRPQWVNLLDPEVNKSGEAAEGAKKKKPKKKKKKKTVISSDGDLLTSETGQEGTEEDDGGDRALKIPDVS